MEKVSATGDSKPSTLRPTTIAIAMALMLAAIWALTHRYQGFARDGNLYAIQALARIHADLGADLYLRYTSQDQYTIFSAIYATFIRTFGLQNAGLLLFVLCTVWFLGAAWILAHKLSDYRVAWLAVALLIIAVGHYGAYGVFHYAEDYLTARSLAEALIVTSLACHFRGWRRLALVIAIGALFIHPLMALPGVLLLICLWLPTRQAVIGFAAGIFYALSIAVATLIVPATTHFFTVLDPVWLDVVRERSEFLFLKYWTIQDWELNARPFVCLTLSSLAIHDERIRKFCIASMLVGASGLMVALIAGMIGSVAILLQGQAWRWVWVTGFVSVLLLAPTVLRVWRDEKCGPICAVLLVAGWTCPIVDDLACTEAALLLWFARAHVGDRAAHYLRWAAMAGVPIAAWILGYSWMYGSSTTGVTDHENLAMARIRAVFGLGIPAVSLAWLFWYRIRSNRSVLADMLVSAALLVSLVFLLPGSFKQLSAIGSPGEIAEFADWRDAIPPTSSVLILPTRKSASFIWFTLGRTSYMSVDQSAGVVFSRATALEVRRRSEVLLPLADPDWKILTDISDKHTGKHRDDASRPLTATTLIGVCNDPQLGFVIAREQVGFDPIRHTHAGIWKDWYLYDCRLVRSRAPAA
jgi:hypothetical protein